MELPFLIIYLFELNFKESIYSSDVLILNKLTFKFYVSIYLLLFSYLQNLVNKLIIFKNYFLSVLKIHKENISKFTLHISSTNLSKV